ncbi:hypothetical protein GCM10025782_25570 [Pedococcus ginsenosidimutans]|uniref:Uncharacterized protein n=1 Tax=Pedococcus ginsenosidimutans TaxID=490570 RepID=A0ABP8YEQ8_9MICO
MVLSIFTARTGPPVRGTGPDGVALVVGVVVVVVVAVVGRPHDGPEQPPEQAAALPTTARANAAPTA